MSETPEPEKPSEDAEPAADDAASNAAGEAASSRVGEVAKGAGESGPEVGEAPNTAGVTAPEVEPAPALESEPTVVPAPPIAVAPEPAPPPAAASRAPRPVPVESAEPIFCRAGGFTLRLEPRDLVRLRELPGAKGRTDKELGEEFFEKQADRLVRSLAEDVAPPAEVRVVVDPYSRQAFLAIERTIRSIVSF